MSADLSQRRTYEPPQLHALGAVQSLTLDGQQGQHGFDGDSYAKRWSRHGDYWHWYRERDHENQHGSH